MLLTKECDYGIRVIRALADGNKKTVELIATEEQIPPKYAYKIVKKLEQAGFVQSTRGRSGGYRLHKPLNSFNLVDVVLAIDSHRYVNECLRADSTCTFKTNPDQLCTVHIELKRVEILLISELGSKTMEEVLKRKEGTLVS